MKNRNRTLHLLILILLITISSCEKEEVLIIKQDPVINWTTPTDITSGTALSINQLNATASVAGTFVYTPATGTVLGVGANQNLKVDFTPTDAVHYNTATKTVIINVIEKDTPVINWTTPTDITSGTVLGVDQLNATASVAGTFVYTPAIGTVLSVGANQNLKVDFTPTDAVNYNTATNTVTINVIEKNNPVINWTTPTDITSGTALGINQLNATASVAGTFVYTPATGTVLSVGANQNLKVDFTPTDAVNYNTATKTVTINVTALAYAILDTDAITNILATTATGGGYIYDDGGSSITERGVCWSTNSNPTVNDSKTSDGAGIGSFTSSISG